jgi:tellurite resistance protein TerC
METSIWLWVGFTVFVLGMLALDLGVFHRSAHAVSFREASIWSVVWISLALIFNVLVWVFRGRDQGLEFLAGYLIEYSLSVDNIFVFVLIFSYFKVPAMYQHRVLFWGILGALVMRAIFIGVGAALLSTFHWIIFVFGGFLIYSGIRMAFHRDEHVEFDDNPIVRLFKRFVPVTKEYEGQSFFVRHGGKLMATPLFIVLLLLESTDLVFALDSVPAIFAITDDPFIVYTSNVFAILGLRALYFLLAGVIDKFQYLKFGLAAVLVFVGFKMVISEWYKIPTTYSLAVIGSVLALSVIVSLVVSRRDARNAEPQLTGD